MTKKCGPQRHDVQPDALSIMNDFMNTVMLGMPKQAAIMLTQELTAETMRGVSAEDLLSKTQQVMREMAYMIAEMQDAAAGFEHDTELETQKSLSDSMTELSNRRAYDADLSKLVLRTQREGRSTIGVILIDLKGLKAINDKISPLAGYAAIKGLANALSDISREYETPYRIGGDEFAIIVNMHDSDKIDDIITRLDRGLCNASFDDPISGNTYRIGTYIVGAVLTASDTVITFTKDLSAKLNTLKESFKHDRTDLSAAVALIKDDNSPSFE